MGYGIRIGWYTINEDRNMPTINIRGVPQERYNDSMLTHFVYDEEARMHDSPQP